MEIYHETSIDSRYFKMKLAKMPNLTYFPPEHRNRDSLLKRDVFISCKKRKQGEKERGRNESKEAGKDGEEARKEGGRMGIKEAGREGKEEREERGGRKGRIGGG